MAVDKKYEADVAAILSHRYDQGGTLWDTPDHRLQKGGNGKDRIDHFEERVLKPAKAALDESCPYTFNYVKVRENPNNKHRS